MDIEQKIVKFEVKMVDDQTGIFEGYAATFSKKPDSYGDVIEPGAFTKTLQEGANRIKILWNHNPNEPIGKPITLTEDAHGLHIKGKLTLGVQRAREVLALMKDGVVNQLSIGYDAIICPTIDGIRHLQEVRLWDASPVAFAANPEAVIVGVKQLELKPYPNEHSCRLNPPGDYDEFRRTNRQSEGKTYSIILGKLKNEDIWEEQAFRYNKDVWDADEARAHCEKHDGTFEAASKALPIQGAEIITPEDKEAAELDSIVGSLKAENDGFSMAEAEKRIEAILSKI
jgi:HK97 family phage prohead protease